jgi:plastocyanin
VRQPVTWVNNDDSPHQITVVSTKERSPIITKGQSAVLRSTRRAPTNTCAGCTRA